MKKSGSMVTAVFGRINDIVSTVENIHGDIAGKPGNKDVKRIRKEERRNGVYGIIKSINGRIGDAVSRMF